jgi:hypothetical protein
MANSDHTGLLIAVGMLLATPAIVLFLKLLGG